MLPVHHIIFWMKVTWKFYLFLSNFFFKNKNLLGGMGTLIVFGGILSIIVTGILFTTIMCYLRIKGEQQHVTHAELGSGN